MRQYGDEALVSSAKRMTIQLYFVLALILARTIFIYGPGFAPFQVGGTAPNTSVKLPALTLQLPLLMSAFGGVLVNATYSRVPIFPFWLLLLLSWIYLGAWSVFPELTTAIACTFTQLCPAIGFFVLAVDFIILVAMFICALNAFFHITDYMRGYWQSENYKIDEDRYYQITDPDNYASDPLRNTNINDDAVDATEDNMEDDGGSENQGSTEEGDDKPANDAQSAAGLFPIASTSHLGIINRNGVRQ